MKPDIGINKRHLKGSAAMLSMLLDFVERSRISYYSSAQ
jgi:hypothetical protein